MLLLAGLMLAPAPAYAISKPQKVRITATNYTAVNVQWKKVSSAKRYKVQWRATGAKKWKSRWVKGTKTKLTGLSHSKSHQVRVTAQNKRKKNSKKSKTVKFKTYMFQTPRGLQVQNVTGSTAAVSWNAVPGASRYRIAWRPANSKKTYYQWVLGRSATIRGTSANQNHVVSVSAMLPNNAYSSGTPLVNFRAPAAPVPNPEPPAVGTPSPDSEMAPTPAPAPALRPNLPAAQLNAKTTGVPAGTNLTLHTGVLKITKDGTVINGLDVKGSIKVNANNVTIKNTRVRGQGSVNIGLINVKAGMTGLKVIDTEIYNEKPHQDTNGIMGANFTLERVNIHHVVDQVHVTTLGNVKILHSWLHSNTHFKNDPNWNGGPSHDDNIQLIGGSNVLVKSSRIEGAKNAAIMVGQNHAPVKNLRVEGNLIRGGWCSINIAPKGHGNMEGNGNSITGNVFHHDQTHTRCAVIAPNGSVPQMTNNTWADTGADVVRTRG